MADFTQAQNYEPSRKDDPAIGDQIFPGLYENDKLPENYVKLSDSEKSVRTIWDSKTREERIQLLKDKPNILEAVKISYRPRVIEEMPDDLSDTRNLIKEYMHVTTPTERLNIFKERHPNYEKFTQAGDRIFAKKGKDYYAVDPDTGIFSKDFGNDVTDVVRDIGRGMAITGAGLLGSPLGVAGGSATSGTYSAALNYLDQQKASELGVRKRPPSWVEAGKDGLIDAAFTAIFGTGGSKKWALKNMGINGAQELAEMTPDKRSAALALASEFEKKQRGILSRSLSYTGKKIAPIMTGSDPELVNIAAKHLDEFREITRAAEKSQDKGASILVEKFGIPARDQITESFFNRQKEIGKKMDGMVKVIPEVDMTPVYNSVDKYADDLMMQLENATSTDMRDPIVQVAEALKSKFFFEEPLSVYKSQKIFHDYFPGLAEAYKKIPELAADKSIYHEVYLDIRSSLPTYKNSLEAGKRKALNKEIKRLLSDYDYESTGVQKQIVEKIKGVRDAYFQKTAPPGTIHNGENVVLNVYEDFEDFGVVGVVGDEDKANLSQLKKFLLQAGVVAPDKIYTAKPNILSGEDAWSFKKDLSKMARLRERSMRPGAEISKFGEVAQDKLRALGDISEVIADQLGTESKKIADIKGGTFGGFSHAYKEHQDLESIIRPMIGSRKDPQKALNVVRNLFKEGNISKLSVMGKLSPETINLAKKIEAYRVWGKRLGQAQGLLKESERPATHRAAAKLAGIATGVGVGAGLSGPLGNAISWPIGGLVSAGILAGTSPQALRTIADVRDYAGQGKKAILPLFRTLYEESRNIK